ncbi:MAG: RNA methyltransferase [Pseudomonadota bacterium]
MRGYFAIGVESLSKTGNFGNLIRTAHAFGASFVFSVNAETKARRFGADTSRTADNLPFYDWQSVDEMQLPGNCQLVGIELLDDAIELPSFRHPARAAYVLGPERASLSPEMIERCDYTIKIPTRFCINVATAGAIVMYDRVSSYGKFAERPVKAGGPQEQPPEHVHGGPRFRTEGRSIHGPKFDV